MNDFVKKIEETQKHKGWIGVDFDGTLAKYDGWVHETHVGDPIPAMVERVKGWLAQGKQVKIFTARAHSPESVEAIEKWCLEHLGQRLPVTNVKDFQMIELWDDRAIRVQSNTGKIL